jgi:hypothetical protein
MSARLERACDLSAELGALAELVDRLYRLDADDADDADEIERIRDLLVRVHDVALALGAEVRRGKRGAT